MSDSGIEQYNFWQASQRRQSAQVRGVQASTQAQSDPNSLCIRVLDDSVIVGGDQGLPIVGNSVGVHALTSGIYPAPQFSSHTITPYASVLGLLQDFKVDATFSNVPSDGTVARIAWALRTGVPGETIYNGVTIHTENGGNCSFTADTRPVIGNLVVATWIQDNTGYSLGAGWNAVTHDGVIGIAWKIWSASDTDTENVVNVGANTAGSVVTYERESFDAINPINVNASFSQSNAGEFGTITTSAITPTVTNTDIICAFGTDFTWPTAPTTLTGVTASTGWTLETPKAVFAGSYAGNSYLFSSIYFGASSGTAYSESLTFPTGVGWTGVAVYAILASVTGKQVSRIIGNPSPWIIQAETTMPNLPYPSVSQAAEYSFGQVSLGINYDLGAAYVSARGDIGEIGSVVSNYNPPVNTIQITNNYLIGNAIWILAISSPSVTAVSAANGLTSAVSVAFTITNQPTDGSFSRLGLWYRIFNVGASWSYYGGIKADQVGAPLSSLLTSGSYTFEFADLINGTVYEFGCSGEDARGDETQVAIIINTSSLTPTVVAPPGVSLNGVNLIPDSSMLLFAGPPYGASSLWSYANFDPTRFCITGEVSGSTAPLALWAQTNGGADVAGGCAYTDLIPVISGQEYSFACMAGRVGNGSSFMGIVNTSDKTANNVAPSSIYASAAIPPTTSGPNVIPVLVTLTWTATFTGNVSIALWFQNIHSGCLWYQPQFEVGASFSGYKPGGLVSSTGAQAFRISQALDSKIASPAGGQVLTYSTANSTWENITPVTTLAADTDVALTTLVNGQVLTYNSTAGKWENLAPTSGATTLAADTDVALTALVDGQVLTYNSAAGKWENLNPTTSAADLIYGTTFPTSPPDGLTVYRTDKRRLYVYQNSTSGGGGAGVGGAASLSALTDVLVSSITNGQVLTFNSTAGKWENVAPVAGSSTLASDTDVSITSPTNGDVLTYNSTAAKWKNAAAIGGGATGGTAFPSSPSQWQLFYRTDLGHLFIQSGSTGFDAQQIADGVIHRYQLNETSGTTATDDGTGTLSNGTYSNVTLGATPLSGDQTYAASFNGSSSYVGLAFKDPNTTAFSIEALIKPTSLVPSSRFIANDHTDTDGKGFQMRVGSSGWEFDVGNNSSGYTSAAYGTAPTTNSIYHVVAVFTGTSLILYVNGTAVATTAYSSTYASGTNNIAFGYDPAYSGDYFTGEMQSVGIYSVALTATQVSNHYIKLNNFAGGWSQV